MQESNQAPQIANSRPEPLGIEHRSERPRPPALSTSKLEELPLSDTILPSIETPRLPRNEDRELQRRDDQVIYIDSPSHQKKLSQDAKYPLLGNTLHSPSSLQRRRSRSPYNHERRLRQITHAQHERRDVPPQQYLSTRRPDNREPDAIQEKVIYLSMQDRHNASTQTDSSIRLRTARPRDAHAEVATRPQIELNRLQNSSLAYSRGETKYIETKPTHTPGQQSFIATESRHEPIPVPRLYSENQSYMSDMPRYGVKTLASRDRAGQLVYGEPGRYEVIQLENQGRLKGQVIIEGKREYPLREAREYAKQQQIPSGGLQGAHQPGNNFEISQRTQAHPHSSVPEGFLPSHSTRSPAEFDARVITDMTRASIPSRHPSEPQLKQGPLQRPLTNEHRFLSHTGTPILQQPPGHRRYGSDVHIVE